MTEATQQHCEKSGAKPGEDNSTHHLVPRAAGATCRYCGKTQQEIESQEESQPAQ